MKLLNKIFIIAIACPLVLGAMFLAFGIMLGGSIPEVIGAVIDRAAATLDALFGWTVVITIP